MPIVLLLASVLLVHAHECEHPTLEDVPVTVSGKYIHSYATNNPVGAWSFVPVNTFPTFSVDVVVPDGYSEDIEYGHMVCVVPDKTGPRTQQFVAIRISGMLHVLVNIHTYADVCGMGYYHGYRYFEDLHPWIVGFFGEDGCTHSLDYVRLKRETSVEHVTSMFVTGVVDDFWKAYAQRNERKVDFTYSYIFPFPIRDLVLMNT